MASEREIDFYPYSVKIPRGLSLGGFNWKGGIPDPNQIQSEEDGNFRPIAGPVRINRQGLRWFLRLDYNGRVQSFLIPLGIGLNGIEGDVLVALGMSAIQISIVKGAVGFENMVNPLLE